MEASHTVALFKFDVVDSTELGRRLGTDEMRKCMIFVHDAVEVASLGFGVERGFPRWEGDGGSAYFRGSDAAQRAVAAALDAVERVRLIPGYELRMRAAVGLDRVPPDEDLTRASSPDFNLAGHAAGSDVCPPNAVCLTEDAYFTLRVVAPEPASKFSYLGSTSRDGAPVFVSPPGKKPARTGGLRAVRDDLYRFSTAIREYFSRPPFSSLRFYGLPQFNFVGSMDLLSVFTPLRVRRRMAARMELEHPGEETGAETAIWKLGVSRLGTDTRPGPKETVEKRQFPNEPAPPPPEDFSSVFRRHRNLVILGDPGSGKTMLLRYLAIVAAGGRPLVEQHLDMNENLFPVHTTAAELLDMHRRHTTEPTDALLGRLLARHLDGVPHKKLAAVISEASERGRAIFLFDGLDEMAEARDRQAAAELVEKLAHQERRRKCRFIATSRLVGYPGVTMPGGKEYVLEPLTREQTEVLARAFYTGVFRSQGHDDLLARREGTRKGDELVRALRQREWLELFARNPLLLTLAALVHIQIGKLPQYRVRLYDVAAQTLVSAWAEARRSADSPGPLRAVDYETEGRAVLPPLALHLQEKCTGGLINERDLLHFISKKLRTPGRRGKQHADEVVARDFLQRLNNAGSLLVERGAGQWGFMHQTFQEYLAAKCLVSEETYETYLLEPRRLYNPRWKEILRFTAGELGVVQGRAVATVRFIRNINKAGGDWRADDLRMNKLLAALCMSDTVCRDARLEKSMAEFLEKCVLEAPLVPPEAALRRALEQLRGTPIGRLLAGRFLAAMRRKTSFAWAPDGLAWLGASEVIPDLIKSLCEDKDALVRGRAAYVLGRIGGSEQAVPDLLRALREDEDGHVRWRAAEALGRTDSEQAVPALLEALREDKDKYVRRTAAEALGRIDSEQAVPALLEALREDEDEYVRRTAAEALEWIGPEQDVPDLLGALREDKDTYVRGAAAMALGRIGPEQAIPVLLEALRRDDGYVRWVAAMALGRIGSEQAFSGLLEALRRDDEHVRRIVAEALGWIGLEQAIPVLLEALREDKDKPVRWIAAKALGRIGSEQAVPDLLEALRKDKDGYLRGTAAEALGWIGSKQVVPDLLKVMRRDASELVRGRAAEALGRIGSEKVVPDLLKALHEDRNRWVRGIAIEALWKIAETA